MAVEYALLIALITLISLTTIRSLASSASGPFRAAAHMLSFGASTTSDSPRSAGGGASRNGARGNRSPRSARRGRATTHACRFGTPGDDEDVHAWIDILQPNACSTSPTEVTLQP